MLNPLTSHWPHCPAKVDLYFLETDFSTPLSTLFLLAHWLVSPLKAVLNCRSTGGGQWLPRSSGQNCGSRFLETLEQSAGSRVRWDSDESLRFRWWVLYSHRSEDLNLLANRPTFLLCDLGKGIYPVWASIFSSWKTGIVVTTCVGDVSIQHYPGHKVSNTAVFILSLPHCHNIHLFPFWPNSSGQEREGGKWF